MFELGIRLAFDKPTIIVKDDKTSYSFDTSPIEHLEYPRDLRFSRIVEFKKKLSEKIRATHLKATSDKAYTTFLKHFGEFTVAKLDKKEISGQEYILEELRSLRSEVKQLERVSAFRSASAMDRKAQRRGKRLDVCLRNRPESRFASAIQYATELVSAFGGGHASVMDYADHKHLIVVFADTASDDHIAVMSNLLRSELGVDVEPCDVG
jgi:hypothetical protein